MEVDEEKEASKTGTEIKTMYWEDLQRLTLWEPVYDIFVLWFQTKKQQFSVCLTNALAPPPIALESCSRAQTEQPV